MKLPMVARYAITSLSVTGALSIGYFAYIFLGGHVIVKPNPASARDDLLTISLRLGEMRGTHLTDKNSADVWSDEIAQVQRGIDASQVLVDKGKIDPKNIDQEKTMIAQLTALQHALSNQFTSVQQLFEYIPEADLSDTISTASRTQRADKAKTGFYAMADRAKPRLTGPHADAAVASLIAAGQAFGAYSQSPNSGTLKAQAIAALNQAKIAVDLALHDSLDVTAPTFKNLSKTIANYSVEEAKK